VARALPRAVRLSQRRAPARPDRSAPRRRP
jgi:hypothetical protein